MGCRLLGGGDKIPFGAVEVDPDAHEPLREAVVDLPEQSVAFRCRGLRPGSLLRYLVHARGGQRDRRMPGEQLKQLGVIRPEDSSFVPAENDARPDDAPAPFQRHANDATQSSALLCGHMAAVDLVVAGKPDGSAARHHGSGHSLGERKDTAGLTCHPDVSLLAVFAGGLIDAAYRTCVAAEQLSAAPQDSFQQGA